MLFTSRWHSIIWISVSIHPVNIVTGSSHSWSTFFSFLTVSVHCVVTRVSQFYKLYSERGSSSEQLPLYSARSHRAAAAAAVISHRKRDRRPLWVRWLTDITSFNFLSGHNISSHQLPVCIMFLSPSSVSVSLGVHWVCNGVQGIS